MLCCFGHKKKMGSQMKKLSERKDQISTTEKRWFAVYTRYKCEKYVATRLEKKGIEVYVPLLKHTKRYKRKIKHVEIPIISCYVFVRITKEDYVRVLQTENVISFLKIRNSLIAIPAREIEVLKWVVGENIVESVKEGNFPKGSKVEVIAGNLTGLKGHVVKRKSKKFLLVSLETIGYTLELNIAEEMLRSTHALAG